MMAPAAYDDEVHPREDGAEDLARQHAAGGRVPCLEHGKCRRRDHESCDRHTAQPHHQGQYVQVPQRTHPENYTDGCMLQTALRNIATRLRIDSMRATSEAGSGHPTTCCSAADVMAALFFAEMRYDPTEPQPPRRRSLRAVEGPRGADALRGVGGGRLHPARAAADAARVHLRSRRPPDAAPAVCGRGDRIARAGPGRRRGHRAERAPHRLRLPHLRADGRRRDGRGLGVGSRVDGGSTTSSTRSAPSWTSTGSARAAATQFEHDMEAYRAPLARRSAGTPSSSTATTSPQCWRRSPRRARTKGQPSVILARTLKGKGCRSWRASRAGTARRSRRATRWIAAVRRARGAARARDEGRRHRDPAPSGAAARTTGAGGDAAGACLQAGRPGRHARGLRHGARQARRGRPAGRRARRRREELHLQRQVRSRRFPSGSTSASSPSR